MKKNHRRNAFTLIEVLIVVIIMAVLAATVIPQFAESTKDAKDAAVKFNLHTMRSQIETYKAQHNGELPTVTDFVTQMTDKSDVNGAQTGTLLYGPYMQEVPMNPFTDTDNIVSVSLSGADATSANVTADGGWLYDETTGEIWPNNTEYYQ